MRGEVGRWLHAAIELSAIGIGVKARTMVVNDFIKLEHVSDKENGAKH